jgi:hypothetical protein
MKPVSTSYILGIDIKENDEAIVIVGEQKSGRMDIVNTFAGEEAIALYNTLTDPDHLTKFKEEIEKCRKSKQLQQQ